MSHKTLPRTIEIEGIVYALSQGANENGREFFVVEKQEGECPRYVLFPQEDKVICSCPDYRHRLRDTTALCKHGEALVARGFLKP